MPLTTYYFRVIAYNEFGISTPCASEETVCDRNDDNKDDDNDDDKDDNKDDDKDDQNADEKGRIETSTGKLSSLEKRKSNKQKRDGVTMDKDVMGWPEKLEMCNQTNNNNNT